MRIPDILPSTKFTTIVGSIALAALLVWGAYVLTHPMPQQQANIAVGTTPQNTLSNGEDWQATLRTIEGSKLDASKNTDTASAADTLLKAAASSNLTTSVGRKLLVNLSQAKSQGLGSDIPTQDSLIADAVAEISQNRGTPQYALKDLSVSANTEASMKTYANAVMEVVADYPYANYDYTIYTIATSTDNADPKRLTPLGSIEKAYSGLAGDLAGLTVPQAFAPLHLQIVNNISRISETFTDIKVLYTDPLRALAALQLYEALTQETLRLFINIAQGLSQNGILFNKDELGSTWSSLVP